MHDTMKCSKWSALLLSVVAAILLAGSGATLAQTFDLWAKAGSTSLPGGASVPVWGFTTSADGTVSAPGGPTLIVNQGETVTVNLTNNLPEASAMHFQGQAILPDLTGAAASGGTKTYTFTATNPGTFLYEAGLLPNAQHQAAMGLYGALVVRPGPAAQAYGDAATAFDDEAVLVLSELDPLLAANPAAFDMRNYAPTYFLINGKAYPDTATISSAAGNKVLLRYVNAGIQHHSMAVLGLRQNFIAKDASLLPTKAHNVAAETLAPGQTGDAIATIPAVTSATKFAIYDGSLMLHNNGTAGYGGMLTFVTAGTGSTDTGPTTSGVTLTPNPSSGGTVVLNAMVSDVASGNSNVIAAEYFIDTPGGAGTGTPMNGTLDLPTVAVSATIQGNQLLALPSGKHAIYVHGQDANSNWGGFSAAILNLDKAGPKTSSLTLTPNPSNGLVSVALSGTGNDTTTGNSNVVAAEYTIDGGPPVAMNVNVAAPVAALSATIPAGLVPGAHTVAVHSQDALLNWGDPKTITLNVVAGGPVTTLVSAARNPNNGALPLNSSQAVVRISATMTSTGSTVAGAEAFIDTPPASVSVRGFPFTPSDGAFNAASEIGNADVPLATINALAVGSHNIYVRGKDAAGNWGTVVMALVPLLIDKTAPTFTSVTLSTTTAIVGETVTLTATGAADAGGAGLAGGQYWIDGTATPPANPTAFAGTSTNFSVPTGGVHTVYVRVVDAAGNWSVVKSATLTVPSAVNDARAITANTNATQTSNANAAAGVLVNDQPIGAAGRTAAIASAPARTAGAGAGTITVTCPAALGTAATPAIGGNTVCTNGAYRVTLNGVGGSGNARQSSKLGTFQFTYTETLNGKTTPPATVTITVN